MESRADTGSVRINKDGSSVVRVATRAKRGKPKGKLEGVGLDCKRSVGTLWSWTVNLLNKYGSYNLW